MPISEKDVLHIAGLARIKLTDAELKKFEHELSSILEFVEKLSAANTDGVKPLTGSTTLKNVLREDKNIDAGLEDKATQILESIPHSKDSWIKVKTILNT